MVKCAWLTACNCKLPSPPQCCQSGIYWFSLQRVEGVLANFAQAKRALRLHCRCLDAGNARACHLDVLLDREKLICIARGDQCVGGCKEKANQESGFGLSTGGSLSKSMANSNCGSAWTQPSAVCTVDLLWFHTTKTGLPIFSAVRISRQQNFDWK